MYPSVLKRNDQGEYEVREVIPEHLQSRAAAEEERAQEAEMKELQSLTFFPAM
eukprot:gene44388-28178_t